VGKKKLIRFAENETFSHLFQYSYEDLRAGFPLKGKWHAEYFHNTYPISLELGCGKGEYTVYLSMKYPEGNFIGVDIKGARLWKGCKTAEEEKIKNVAFIRTRVQLIGSFFATGEVSEIWLTFPDPQPRHAKENKRLTSPEFLARYREILAKDGIIHLKTDNEGLFEYTLKTIREEGHDLILSERDIYGSSFEGDATAIKTFYERMFLKDDIPIKYLEFRLRDGR
jgi:tRNA (guanine-N7-)-methyltransferase